MKIKLRSRLRPVKPIFKGIILVLIGLYITREYLGETIVGIGRFNSNMLYGTIAYIFLAISGLLCIKIMLIDLNLTNNKRFNKKHLIIIEFCAFCAGLTVTILNIIFNSLNLLTILFPIIIGIVWTVLLYVLPKRISEEDVEKIFLSLIFSLGLLLGAGLNTILIPAPVFLFLSALSFSELSREVAKDHFITKRKEKPNFLKGKRQLDESLKLSIWFQIIAIISLIVPIFLFINYPVFYIYILIPTLIFLGLGLYFSYKGMNEKKMFKRINILMKFGLLFEMLAILLSS